MVSPSELVEHYSTKAFQTRLTALTSVGAVLGADVVWKPELIQSEILGIGLLLVMGSLAELNRRYTYAYLCACIASTEADQSQSWQDFKDMNEGPYSLGKSKVKKRRRGHGWSRFLLSWGTYLPGLAAGAYLAWSKHNLQEDFTSLWKPWTASLLALALLLWWFVQTVWTYNPEDFRKNSQTRPAVPAT